MHLRSTFFFFCFCFFFFFLLPFSLLALSLAHSLTLPLPPSQQVSEHNAEQSVKTVRKSIAVIERVSEPGGWKRGRKCTVSVRGSRLSHWILQRTKQTRTKRLCTARCCRHSLIVDAVCVFCFLACSPFMVTDQIFLGAPGEVQHCSDRTLTPFSPATWLHSLPLSLCSSLLLLTVVFSFLFSCFSSVKAPFLAPPPLSFLLHHALPLHARVGVLYGSVGCSNSSSSSSSACPGSSWNMRLRWTRLQVNTHMRTHYFTRKPT